MSRWHVSYDTRLIPKRYHPACPVAYKSGLPCANTCYPRPNGDGFQMSCLAHKQTVVEASDQDLYRKYTPKCPYCVSVGAVKPEWCVRQSAGTRIIHPTCFMHAANVEHRQATPDALPEEIAA
jgi:hypothetical protein